MLYPGRPSLTSVSRGTQTLGRTTSHAVVKSMKVLTYYEVTSLPGVNQRYK